MKKIMGWIISNGSLTSHKYMEIITLYQEAARDMNIDLKLIFNNELLMGIEKGILFLRGKQVGTSPDFVLFLDKDISLAHGLEQMNIRLFNSSKVIALCDDKSKTFQALAGNNITMPKTVIAPLVFKGMKEEGEDYINQIEEAFGYPLVIKECYGSFGEQVYLVHNREELRLKRQELIAIPHIYQEFIASSRGRDVRLNVIGGEVVASMLRTSPTDFRANVSNGGSMEDYKPSPDFKALALKVCQLIGADFAGVDLLFGKDEEPILCEVNSNAHIKNIQMCTGINVAAAILKHILKELGMDESMASLQ